MHVAPSKFREISDSLEQFPKGWNNSQQDCINFPQVKGRSFYYSQRDSTWTPGKSSHTPAWRKKKKETEHRKQEQTRNRGFQRWKTNIPKQKSKKTHTHRERGLQTQHTHWDYREAHMPPKTHVTGLRQHSATSIMVF